MKWVVPYVATAAVTLAGMTYLQHCSRAQSTHPRVIDGDTLVVNGEHFRLYGIDAPELNQTCPPRSEPGQGEQANKQWAAGYEAKWALQDLVRGGTIHIERHGTDRYKRTLAVVTSELMGDINAEMVSRGMAWAYMQYSWRYGAEQAVAKANRVGIWAHDCQPAWEYRRGEPGKGERGRR